MRRQVLRVDAATAMPTPGWSGTGISWPAHNVTMRVTATEEFGSDPTQKPKRTVEVEDEPDEDDFEEEEEEEEEEEDDDDAPPRRRR